MKQVDLMSLREDASGAYGFEVRVHNMFMPVNYTIRFDRLDVNLSASPYVCLKNEYSTMTINYVKNVCKEVSKDHSVAYRLRCADYLAEDSLSYMDVQIKIFPKTS